MRKIDLTNIAIGDMLALAESSNGCWTPRVSHRLLIVNRVTATQVCCFNEQGGTGEWRFRKSDGKMIGQHYTYAEIASPDLIASVMAQRAVSARHEKARKALDGLEGKYLHQLKLSLEQIEALAKAWAEIKAMKQ